MSGFGGNRNFSIVPQKGNFLPSTGYEAAVQALAQANTPLTKEAMRQIGEKLVIDLTESQAMGLKRRYAAMKMDELYIFIGQRAIATIQELAEVMYAPRPAKTQYYVERFMERHIASYNEQMEKVTYDAAESLRGLANRSVAYTPPEEKKTLLARIFDL